MSVRGVEEEISLSYAVELPWFLTAAAPYFSWTDLHSLQAVNRSCWNQVSAWIGTWPEDMQDFLQTLRTTKTSKILVFGCHRTQQPGFANDWHRIPPPILNFAFGSLTFDPSGKQVCGSPWSEYTVMNQQPLNLGRDAPCVCPADDHGTQIFYCGGLYSVGDTTERWVRRNEFLPIASTTTALFDVHTASWRSLPPMPEGRSNAGVGRVGTKIYIIGGEVVDPNNNNNWMVAQHSVLCFDLQEEQWMVDSGIPNFPGVAYCGLAVAALDETTIVVAGGAAEVIVDNPPIGAPTRVTVASREAFSLDLASGSWNALPLLPEIPDASSIQKFSGFLYEDPDNGNERSFAVNCLTQSFHLSDGNWEALSDMRGRGVFPTMPNCFTGICGSKMAISFGSIGTEIFIARRNTWRRLLPEAPLACFGYRVVLGSNGEAVRVSLSYNDKAVAVSKP